MGGDGGQEWGLVWHRSGGGRWYSIVGGGSRCDWVRDLAVVMAMVMVA